MIAAASVCAAAMSQAASLAWGSAGYLWDPAKNAKADAITGGSIVLALVTDGTDWKNGVSVLDTGVRVDSGMASAIGKVQGSATGGYFEWAFADGTLKNGDVLTVLFKDTEGKFSQLAYVDATGKLTDTLVSETYTVTGPFERRFYSGWIPVRHSGYQELFGAGCPGADERASAPPRHRCDGSPPPPCVICAKVIS